MKTSETDVENKIDSVNADLLKDLRTSSEYSELASVRVFLIFKNKKPPYPKTNIDVCLWNMKVSSLCPDMKFL